MFEKICEMKKLFLFILVAITLETISETHARPDNYQLSENEENTLNEIGAQWKEVISWEHAPCNEFIDFVCTNKDHPKPHNRLPEELLKDIFKEKPELVTETEGKYLKFASSCASNVEHKDKLEFLKWFKLDNSIGEWPALERDWDDSKFNLPLAIGEMNSYNHPVVFQYVINFDTNGSYGNSLTILKEYPVDIALNRKNLETVFEELGVKNPEEVLADASMFEKAYNAATDPVESLNNIEIKYSELRSHFPKLELDKQIEIAYGQKFPDDYLIVVKSNEELQNIYEAISKLSPKVIANYFFCTVVYRTYVITYLEPYQLFAPVLKTSIIKYLYTENMKEIVKGMYITILDYLREYFKAECTTEQIVKFVTEDIFQPTNEEHLMNEFKEVSTNDECIKNYNFLKRIEKRRLAKPTFNCKNPMLEKLKHEMSDLTKNSAYLIGRPSSFIFESITFPLVESIANYFFKVNGKEFSTSQKECFSQQITNKELTEKDMKIIFAAQFIMNIYSKWIDNYPDIVKQENKILQNYGLSSEKLSILSVEKNMCDNEESFNIISTAFTNSVDFPKIFDCAARSELNADKKCSLW